MDPNATLYEIAAALELARPWNTWRAEARRLRETLLSWVRMGGFAPDWRAYPEAARFCRVNVT